MKASASVTAEASALKNAIFRSANGERLKRETEERLKGN